MAGFYSRIFSIVTLLCHFRYQCVCETVPLMPLYQQQYVVEDIIHPILKFDPFNNVTRIISELRGEESCDSCLRWP